MGFFELVEIHLEIGFDFVLEEGDDEDGGDKHAEVFVLCESLSFAIDGGRVDEVFRLVKVFFY